MKRALLLILLTFAAVAQTPPSKTFKFPQNMQCGIVRRGPSQVQVYCYQGSTVVYNSIAIVSPAFTGSFGYSPTATIPASYGMIVFLLKLPSGPSGLLSYEVIVDSSTVQKGTL